MLKKTLAFSVIAGIISTTPWEFAEDPMSVFGPVFDATNKKVSDIVSPKQEIPEIILEGIQDSQEINQGRDFKESIDTNLLLFPVSVQTIWLDRMSDWLLWNMLYWGLIEWINPLMVDIDRQGFVNCAWTIKSLIAYTKNPFDRSNAEDLYVRKQNIDAWTLPEELKKVWYKQVINLMKYFDESRVWSPDIVSNKELYKKWLLEIWNYLRKQGKVGSLVFIYFNLSDYKGVVRSYNQSQKQINHNYTPHINTHQAMYLWNGSIEFQASDIKMIHNSNMSEMWNEVDIINYIANFVQFRWWYKSALTDQTKKTIIENLSLFHSLIDIYVNWEKINIEEELKKPIDIRKKISKNDIINIWGAVLWDWFHPKNSKRLEISENNNFRTIFDWEFFTIWTYTASELMEPNNDFYERNWNKNPELQAITDELKVTNLYFLKEWETLDFSLKVAILRFKLWKQKLLEYTPEEIELSNKVQESKWTKKHFELVLKYVSIKEKKINDIISNLSNEEKIIFDREYSAQIHWLQMIWYLQNESKINDWAAYINRPIPYFYSFIVEKYHPIYISVRKLQISEYNKTRGNIEKDNSIMIYFYPTDNSAKVFNQLESELKKYLSRYPNFAKIKDLDALKRNKFLDLVIDKISNDPSIDVSNWKIPSMRSMSIPLDYIDTVLLSILEESYVPELPLSEIDDIIIKVITKNNKQDYNYLAYIIIKENYENGVPKRKILKKIATYFNKVSSYWDYQLRFINLTEEETALKWWPNVEQIQRAISYLESPELENIVQRRLSRYEEVVEPDFILLEELKKATEWINEGNRLERWKKIFEIFKVLFRFNDTREINIIWKIIQASLTYDKIHEHFANLNWWLEKSWVSLEDIYFNTDLQERYAKSLLIIHNQSEKKALVWIAESYLIRLLEAMWDDLNHESYPRLDKTVWCISEKYIRESFESLWEFSSSELFSKLVKFIKYVKIDCIDCNDELIKKQIKIFSKFKRSIKWKFSSETWYTEEVIRSHLAYYKDRFSLIASDDESVMEVKNEIIWHIKNLLNWNIQANDIYKLFGNKKIVGFLEANGYDKYPIPTLNELWNTPFREILFSYAKTPYWKTPPKIYDFARMIKNTWLALCWIGIAWLGGFLIRRKRKNGIKNQESMEKDSPTTKIQLDEITYLSKENKNKILMNNHVNFPNKWSNMVFKRRDYKSDWLKKSKWYGWKKNHKS